MDLRTKRETKRETKSETARKATYVDLEAIGDKGVTFAKVRRSGNIQGTFREHSVNI
jgi:hypothetical protein